MAYVLPQVEVHQIFKEIPFNTVKNLNAFVFGPHYDLYKFNNPDIQDKLRVKHYMYEGDNVNITDGKLSMVIPNFDKLDTKYIKLFAKNMVISKLGSTEKLDVEFTTGTYDRTNAFTTAYNPGFNEGEFLAVKSGDEVVGIAKIISVTKQSNTDSWKIITDSNELTTGRELFLCDYIKEAELERSYENYGTDSYSNAYEVTITKSTNTTGYTVTITGALKYNQQTVYAADLYVQFRCLSHTAADSIYVMERVTDVTSYLGEVDPDNPLALGVYKACQNSGDRVVYYMATKGTSLDDYSWVLEKASLSEDVYAFVPLTNDRAIMDLVESHVDSMSGPQSKRWRIAFVCPDIPTEDIIFDEKTMPDGTKLEANITKLTGTTALLQFVNDYDKPETFVDTTKLVIGDIVGINKNDLPIVEIPDTYSVIVDLKDSGLLEDVVPTNSDEGTGGDAGAGTGEDNGDGTDLEGGEDPEAQAAALGDTLKQVDIEYIKHILTKNETAEAISAQSRGFANRRIYSVFPPVVSSNGVTMHGMYAAAAVAGLMSSVLPQQPLTNVELNGFDDIPMVYTQYSMAQLNKIAEGGTFIVMQDLPLDKVYIRHQISTAYSDNNLNTAELSITKNLDAVSYFFAERLKPYIGKYNITPQLLGVLHNVISEGLGYLSSTTGVGLYGPMVIAEGTSIDRLYQDPALQDQVQCELTLNLPKPFNVLKLYLNV